MLGHRLALWGDGTVVDEGLEGLPISTLKHHPKLFQSCFVVIGFFGVDVEGFQVGNYLGIECSPVL